MYFKLLITDLFSIRVARFLDLGLQKIIFNIWKILIRWQYLQMSGWGLVNFLGEHPKNLQKLQLPILSKDICRSINVPHVPNYFSKRLEWRTFCAGYVNSKFFNFAFVLSIIHYLFCRPDSPVQWWQRRSTGDQKRRQLLFAGTCKRECHTPWWP